MSEPQDDEKKAIMIEPEAQASAATGTWDPLTSVRKTISPTQRIELLKMPVPILPPEDFMDTADLQRGRAVPSRRFLPLVFALLGGLLLLLFAGLWSRFSSSPAGSDETTGAEPPKPSSLPVTATLSSAMPAPAPAPSSAMPAPPASVATAASAKERGPSPALAAIKPLEPQPLARPKPPSVPSSKPTSITAEPAPSGITFWTQPR